jgi:hypothetical protein
MTAPPRPQGTAPFRLMPTMADVLCEERSLGDEEFVVTEKYDGAFFEIKTPPGASLPVGYSRNKHPCLPTSKGILGVMGRAHHEHFLHLDPRKVVHPKYGPATALYGELFVVRNDQVAVETTMHYPHELQDLQALMHGTNLKDRSFGLRLFWCSFASDDPAQQQTVRAEISWAQRLALCKAAFGPESVVRVFVDTTGLLGIQNNGFHFIGLQNCYEHGEGLVYFKGGKFYKDKAVRPVDMLLVAAGLTHVQGKLIPSHFYWGVRDPGALNTFAVLLVEDMRYLFEKERSDSGKIQLSVGNVSSQKGTYSYKGGRPNYFGGVLDAHFRMISGIPFVRAESVERRRVELEDGRTLIIGENRRASFTECKRVLFPSTPPRGVIGFNAMWQTGSSKTVAGLHFQAAKLVATEDYGHAVYRALLDRPSPTPAESLIKIATKMTRSLSVHALEVYRQDVPDLTFGTLAQEFDSDKGMSTDSRDQSSDESSDNDESSDGHGKAQSPKKRARSPETDDE